MIAVDTSVILAMALAEPEADSFTALLGREAVAIGWPTLLEARMVLTGKGFPNASDIVGQLVRLPNVTAIAFDAAHYHAAERAFDRFGKGRHPAALNMGDHLGATETYMRLALKAQSQCRATLESLSEIRNPRSVAFVRQANIAAGHQQVNNGVAPAEGPSESRDETGITQCKLLEAETTNVTRLDARTKGKAG